MAIYTSVDGRPNVASELKETGQRLLTAHTHMNLYEYTSA